jgi:hypothetical protein
MTIISWQRAMIWSIKYQDHKNFGIEIIDFFKDDFIKGVTKNFPIPAVVKTKKYFKKHHQDPAFSRKNIFIRDDFVCQYCYKQFDYKNLTYDHVIPKSQWNYNNGSPTIWTNIVTCCVLCNRKKSNKTPKQASMKLLKAPIKPNKSHKYLPILSVLTNIKQCIPDEWKPYLTTYFIDQ